MTNYAEFLEQKAPRIEASGTEPMPLHESLFPFQRAITEWAIRLGRAAIFSDCGTGKARMSLEWARHFAGRVLVVAPLGVAYQTIEEGAAVNIGVHRVLTPGQTKEPGIYITNYERLHKFIGESYDAIVLDESSILKSLDGKTRTMLLREFTHIPRRLCCTATPSPNDVTELANHAEFLGVMSRVEMLATFFVHDSGGAGNRIGWRLKGHAAKAMFEWMAEWAVYVRHPSDIGFENNGFILPPLSIRDEVVQTDWCPAGQLFPTGLGGIGSRSKVRRYTMPARIDRAVQLINDTAGQWLVWCGLNDEGRGLANALGDNCVLVEGKDTEEKKIDSERRWRAGHVRTMVTKPSIFGFGLNWQHCHNMMFLGLGDSYEQYYQAIRRCWRFGQGSPVDVHIVVSNVEGEIAANVRSKEAEASRMAEGVIESMREKQTAQLHGGERKVDEYKTDMAEGDGWRLMLGDSIERMGEVQDGSVALSIYSPPFASLYTYSASTRDIGNCADYEEFFDHFGHLIPKILKATIPGRRTCVHVQQVSTTKVTHGVIGWRDFRADVVKAYIAAGWVYDGEIVIDKDPQAQAIRTKALRNGTPVLTPDGWMPIEEISRGDHVIGKDGKPTVVTAVHRHGVRDVYRVYFTDGASIDCDAQHLWRVQSEFQRHTSDRHRVVPLETLMGEGFRNARGRNSHTIPLCEPIQMPDALLPLDPYTLGVLLGDGGLTTPTVTIATDPEIIDSCIWPDTVTPRVYEDRNNGILFCGLSSPEWNTNALRVILDELGLLGLASFDKFIPLRYLSSSIDQRWALLQGLLDTDGMCTRDGSVRFSTSSPQLADDVNALVRSLGGLCRTRLISSPQYKYKDTTRIGRPSFLSIIQFNGTKCPFCVQRKASRWKPRTYTAWRAMEDAHPVGRDGVTCIEVEAPDGLFVAKDYIVTHNSKALMFIQKERDAAWLRPAMADYILLFRHPGENPVPVKSDVTNDEWILWARPIWYGIRESDVLKYSAAREDKDEKHICPLQLETIRRCIRLWSNPGEVILDPFAGIGSTGYVALESKRRFVGIELKESYYKQALRHLDSATAQQLLFDPDQLKG